MRSRLVGLSVVLASIYGCATASKVSSAVEVPVPGPTVATRLVIASLSSPDPSVRARSAWQLAGATELKAEACQALEPLRADQQKAVRYAAAWALGHLGGGSGEAKSDNRGSSPPKPIHIARPQYPAAAYAKKVEGTVIVDLLIGEQGEVAYAEIRRSIPDLDAAALDCVRQWTFQPAQVDGSPRATVAHAPVAFRIY
jgi:TonB family protein